MFRNHVFMHCFTTLLGEYDFYIHNRDNSNLTAEMRK